MLELRLLSSSSSLSRELHHERPTTLTKAMPFAVQLALSITRPRLRPTQSLLLPTTVSLQLAPHTAQLQGQHNLWSRINLSKDNAHTLHCFSGHLDSQKTSSPLQEGLSNLPSRTYYLLFSIPSHFNDVHPYLEKNNMA